MTAWVRLDRVRDGFATAVSEDAGSDSAFALQYVPSGAWALSARQHPGAVPGPTRTGPVDAPCRRPRHPTGRLTLYVDGESPRARSRTRGSRGRSARRRAGPVRGEEGRFLARRVDAVRAYGGALTDEGIRRAYQSGH